jgi:hypothetical protein
MPRRLNAIPAEHNYLATEPRQGPHEVSCPLAIGTRLLRKSVRLDQDHAVIDRSNLVRCLFDH